MKSAVEARKATITKIALTGPLRAGKDAVALRASANHGFLRYAFGNEVKRLAHELFPDVPANPKPRRLYQQVGEKLCEIDPMVWVSKLERHLDYRVNFEVQGGETDIRVMITDLRKPAEYEWARSQGYTIIRVTAPEDVRKARAEAAGDDFKPEDMAHDTESYADKFSVDYEIVNDEGLSELWAKVDEIMTKIMAGGGDYR